MAIPYFPTRFKDLAAKRRGWIPCWCTVEHCRAASMASVFTSRILSTISHAETTTAATILLATGSGDVHARGLLPRPAGKPAMAICAAAPICRPVCHAAVAWDKTVLGAWRMCWITPHPFEKPVPHSRAPLLQKADRPVLDAWALRRDDWARPSLEFFLFEGGLPHPAKRENANLVAG